MANKVEILSLDINTSALIAKMAETRAKINELQTAQKQLTTENKTTSAEFQKNVVELGRLQSSYNQQKAVVTQLSTASEQFAQVTHAITSAVESEIQSIDQARDNNKQLLTLRNQLNLSTDEGVQKLNEINAKLNENNEFIKQNVSAYEQQKISIGQYKEQIGEAFDQINIFNGGIGGFIQRSKEAGGAGNLVTESFKGMTAGLYGMIKAGLAFIATPIGAVIAALGLAVGVVVGAFKFMQASMNSTEAGANKLAKVTGAITGIFNGLFKVLKPLGEFIFNGFVKYVELAGAALDKLGKAASATLRFLGFDKAAASVDNFSNSIKESSKAGEQLAVAEGKLAEAQRKSRLTQLEYQKQAEKLRQVRDDESKSLEERTKANEQLGVVLKQQLADELAIAKQALVVANLRIQAEGKSRENLDAQAAALTEIADIQERITGQESEQLANLNSLRKEAADKAKEQADKASQAKQAAIDKDIQKSKDEIELFIQQQGIKKKSLEEQLKFEEQLATKRLAVLDKEFKAGKMGKEAYEAEKLRITNEANQKIVDATISNAQRELDIYKKGIEQKKADDTFFTQEKLNAKVEENAQVAQKEIEFHQLRLAQGVINEQEYQDAVDLVKENQRIKNEEAEKIREEAKKEQQAIDLENQRIVDEEKFTNDFDLQLSRENQRYLAEIAAAEKTGADKTLIQKKHAIAQEKIEKAKFDAQLQSASDAFGGMAQLLGESTAAGKAAAIAQATINAYLGITSVLSAQSVLPEPAGSIAKGIAAAGIGVAALMNVKKIVSTKVPSKAVGGLIGGVPTLGSGLIETPSNLSVPLSNGDNQLIYAKTGEIILNREQQARAGGSAFFRSIGVPGFAGGGQVGGNHSLGSLNGIKVDMDGLAERMAQANRSLPAPVVSVVDITDTANRVSVIESGANF
ncbi:hypothetical protein ABGT15_04490 [Flavobacterium enshiense]|uniref:hypothetical protein n=1 Tax=Flavobacterium enshiense TaxID=1341165 RepID=UPI00345C6ABD